MRALTHVQNWLKEVEAKLATSKPRSTERKRLRRALTNLKSAQQSLDLAYTAQRGE